MGSMEQRQARVARVARVAREVGSVIRRQARGRWSTVRMAERNEGGRHVWRFRSAADGAERYLHITHETMVRGNNTAARLLNELGAGEWLDRLDATPHTALVLSGEGRLEPWSAG